MSPHGIVLILALILAVAGKLVFPQFTLRIVVLSAIALPLGLTLYLGESPSLLGLALVVPIALLGAVVGVAAGGFLASRWFRRSS